MSRPLDGKTFASLMAPFEPFETAPLLAVAVSGGRDSLALALLARDWAAARGGRIVGLIVDHGLRAGSAAEAGAAAATLQRLGIEAEILPWAGAKPRTGLQEAARQARYRLLWDACRRAGALHLLIAHHADDQAETLAMRAARDSGPDGMAGMAALSEVFDVRLLRPLLGVPRNRLTATLEAHGVPWCDDPSNADPRFERARLRRQPLPAIAIDSGRADRDARLAEAALDIVTVDADGTVAVDPVAFGVLERDMQERLLGRLVLAISGGAYPPRRDRLRRAAQRLLAAGDRGPSGRGQDFTLAQCKLLLRQTTDRRRPRWIVRPERGRKEGRNGTQGLVPAAFFACGASPATHLESRLTVVEPAREPVQP